MFNFDKLTVNEQSKFAHLCPRPNMKPLHKYFFPVLEAEVTASPGYSGLKAGFSGLQLGLEVYSWFWYFKAGISGFGCSWLVLAVMAGLCSLWLVLAVYGWFWWFQPSFGSVKGLDHKLY
jgi:hypothetical protein